MTEHPAEQDGQDRLWRRTAVGGFMIVIGYAAGLPLGLVVSALLARGLGPEDFGHYSVAASLFFFAQSTVSALFNRAAIKIVADADGWRPVAVALARLQLLLGLGMGLVLFLSAEVLAALMNAPELASSLRLFAAGLPVVTLSGACHNVMIARHLFGRGALFPVVYDVARLVLVVAFLSAGWGVAGAVLAVVGSSFIQLIFALRVIRLPLWTRAPLLPSGFLRYSFPLALDSLGKRLYGRIDLWTVQALSGSVAAGYYGAVQSFNYVGVVVTASLGPLLLATASRAWTTGERGTARAIMRQVLRLALCLLPFAALGAGSASELIVFVYGSAYLPSAPLLAWTSFSIAGLVVMSLLTVMLVAISRPEAGFAFNVPLLGLASIGCLLLVPRVGAVGAAATITLTTWAVDLAILAGLRHWCGVGAGRTTVLRVLAVGLVAYELASAWQVPAPWVIAKLLVLCAAVLLLMLALGEVTRRDLSFAFSLVQRDPAADSLPAK